MDNWLANDYTGVLHSCMYMYILNSLVCNCAAVPIAISRIKSSTVIQVMDILSNSDVKTSINIILQIAKVYPTTKLCICSTTSWNA